MSLMPFAARESRLNQAVACHLANATIQLDGGVEVGAIYDLRTPADSPFVDVATVQQHTISACVAGMGGEVSEGSELILRTAAWPAGQRCQITTAVVPDAGGWATFDVVLLAAGDEGGAHV